MNSRIWVYSGNRPSNGAKELAAQDGFLRLRDDRFHKVKPHDQIINWGVSAHINHPLTINFPPDVKGASNKRDALNIMGAYGVSVVPWTIDPMVALNWCLEDHTVVLRNKLTGHSGDGIFIIEKGKVATLADLHNYGIAPLYTKYVWKVREFRVHVVNGKVIDTQQKIKDPDREVVTWKVRSHANGFIFVRNNIADCVARDELAIAAVSALGLDFGAVDIIEDKKGNLYVLEVNTAPGLEGKTVESYANAFKEMVNGG